MMKVFNYGTKVVTGEMSEVMRLYTQGMSMAEIAVKLGIPESTVRYYITKTMK